MKFVDHIAILVSDLDTSQQWYEENCSAELIFEDHKYKRMKMNNTTIALIDKKHYKHAHFGVLVDCVKEFPTGGKIVPHRDGTVGCYTEDPDGNMVEFIYYSPDMREKLNIDEV
jgi:catechol 2,3-dioxygenase-like lactoylglutathione lyase family enzyme